MPTFLLMDDSADELLCCLVWLLQRQQQILLHIHTTRCDHSPRPQLGFSTLHHMICNSITIMVTAPRPPPPKKKHYPGCLAHAVIGMFYSVVANQRQPQYTFNILQRRERGGGRHSDRDRDRTERGDARDTYITRYENTERGLHTHRKAYRERERETAGER